MNFLKCKICDGELDIIGSHRAVNKIVKCKNCGYCNQTIKTEPEVLIKRKRE